MQESVACCLITFLLAANAGCAGARAAGSDEHSDMTGLPDNPTADSAAAQSSGAEALASKTLSEHLSRPVEEIEVVSVTPIDWPDSSLGCPRPDRQYMQVITPGHVAVLRHGGATYHVHMAGGRAFVCERTPGEAAGEKQPVPKLALPLEHLQTLARADLARQLGVPVEQVSLAGTQPAVWRDANLGCPQAGESYETAPTKGYVLGLSYRGRLYRYHTDRFRLIPCPPFARE